MDEDTFGGYQCGIESSIYPYFADKGYTLADLEQNPQLIKDYYDYKMDTRKVKLIRSFTDTQIYGKHYRNYM